MAPKGKEPPAKVEKPGDKKGAAPAGKPGDKPKPIPIMLNPKARKIAIGVAAGSFSLFLLVFLLIHIETNNILQLIGAVSSVRGTMIYHNESLDSLDDLEMLAVTKQLMFTMSELQARDQSADQRIDKITGLLANGWLGIQGRLYHLMDKIQNDYYVARANCDENKALVFCPDDAREQQTVNNLAKTSGKKYWIGLYKEHNDWKWLSGKNLSALNFWAAGEPTQGNTTKDCAQLHKDGKWHEANCKEQVSWICKLWPEQHWPDDEPSN